VIARPPSLERILTVMQVPVNKVVTKQADWDEVAAIVRDAYRTVGPKAPVVELDRTRS
jgi:hypothetical protein